MVRDTLITKFHYEKIKLSVGLQTKDLFLYMLLAAFCFFFTKATNQIIKHKKSASIHLHFNFLLSV